MEDEKIVELYWERDEAALTETADKYGRYCYGIAYNVLAEPQETEECVNDTWLDAWNSIPPHRPSILSTFLGKITRRIAVDRWRKNHAYKRGGGQMPGVLEELDACVPVGSPVEETVEKRLLEESVSAFISALPDTEQRIFLCRYWYMDSVGDIARRWEFSESKVKSMLHRTREKLRNHLTKEGLG